MKRNELITELKKNFGISELVCPHTVAAFGEKAWQFLNTELLETLFALRREIFNVATYVNYSGMTQRGLRCNICELVKEKSAKNQIYLSSHCNGAGLDIDFQGFTAEQARERIRQNADKLPHQIRLEKDVNWVHVDVYDDGSGRKISEFYG